MQEQINKLNKRVSIMYILIAAQSLLVLFLSFICLQLANMDSDIISILKGLVSVDRDILNLIKPILRNQADIVVGSKKMGTCNYKVALHAKMGEFFIKKCLWFLTRQKVNNNQSGFRAFKKNTLELFNEMRFKGMGFTTEILFKAALNNFRIAEVPISNHARKFGNTNVQLKNIIKSIISCILIYFFKKLKMSFNKTFLKNNIGFDKNF